MSEPANAMAAVSPGRSVTTGTPRIFGLGPNMVVRTCTAVVEVPVRVTATSVGQPVRRHGAPARFVKAMYPPTFPAATSDLTSLILSCEVVQVGAGVPCALATIARATSVAATKTRTAPVIASSGIDAVARELGVGWLPLHPRR